MTLSIIDNTSYVNGIRLDTDTIPVEEIEDSLKILVEDLDMKLNQAKRIRDRRDELIVHAYKHGFSVIKISNILNCTRRGVYDVLDKFKQEDKQNEEE